MPSRRVELALAHVAALGTTALLISLAAMALSSGDVDGEPGWSYDNGEHGWCGAAVRNAGAFGIPITCEAVQSNCRKACYDDQCQQTCDQERATCQDVGTALGDVEWSGSGCPWRWSSEVFFGVASLLPLASVLSALAAFTFHTEQDRVAKALALQGKVGEAPMGVSSCVSGLLAKVTAVLAPVTWLGLLFLFGGQWAGSSLLVGLLVEPLILVGCAAILALLCGAVRTVCFLCCGKIAIADIREGLCGFFCRSLAIGVAYFYLSWFAIVFIGDKPSPSCWSCDYRGRWNPGYYGLGKSVSQKLLSYELLWDVMVVLTIVCSILCSIAALCGMCIFGSSLSTEEKAGLAGCIVYLVLSGLTMALLFGEGSGNLFEVNDDDVPLWTYAPVWLDCIAMVAVAFFCCLGLIVVIMTSLTSCLVDGLKQLCAATCQCLPTTGAGPCDCFAPELAVLKKCCCPKHASATPATVVGAATATLRAQTMTTSDDVEAATLRAQTMTTSDDVEEAGDRWFYHGTSLENALSIQRHGFDVKRSGTNAGAMLGPGLYVTASLEKALNYAKRMPAKGVIMRLEIDLGRVYTCKPQDPHLRDWSSIGYDSAYSPEGANGIREEHCIAEPNRRVQILDCVLGNTRKAHSAGYDVEKGKVIRLRPAERP